MKNRKPITAIIVYFSLMGLGYLLTSFVTANIDFREWNDVTRFTYAILGTMIAAIFATMSTTTDL